MTTQLDASIGFKKQTDYNTPSTPDRFLEFTDESLDFDRTFYQGAGLRPGSRAARSKRRSLVKDGGAGDIGLEVPTKGIGALFELLFGVASSTLVPTSTGVYQQLFTLLKNDYLPAATIQKGIPRLGANAVDAYTLNGATCSNFSLELGAADVLKLKTSWTAKELLTTTAYATPTYPTPFDLFSFTGAALTVGGTITLPTTTALATGGTTVANVRDFSFEMDNGLDSGGYNIGGQGKRTRAAAVGVAEAKGKLTAEYSGTDFRDAVRDQADLALVATFTGPVAIETTFFPTLQLVLPNIRFEGEMPKSNGGDVITQSLDYTAFDNLTAASPVYLVMRTSDTAL